MNTGKVLAMHTGKAISDYDNLSPFEAVISAYADCDGNAGVPLPYIIRLYSPLVQWGKYSVFCGYPSKQGSPAFSCLF
jgi:hypothetical protein